MNRSSDKKSQLKARLANAKTRAATASAKRASQKFAKAAAKQSEKSAKKAAKIAERAAMKTNSSKKARREASGRRMLWDDWLLLGIVCCSTLMIVGALCTNFIDTPREAAEKELTKIADDYYVMYLYPRLLGNLDNNPAEVLSAYKDTGVSPTFLRQLLKYNDGEFAKSASVFSAIACNTNRTGVRYFPTEPYGPRDYTVTYLWDCDE